MESTTVTTEKVSAVDAAILKGKDSLSDGVREFKAAKAAERAGKPLDQVEIPVEKQADGTVTPVDERVAKREARRAKQEEINEGARKAAGRIVEEYEAKVKAAEEKAAKFEAELSELRRPRLVQPTATQPASAVAEDPEPNPNDTTKYEWGASDAKYLRDLHNWDTRQLLKKQRDEEIQRTQVQERQSEWLTSARKFQDRFNQAKEDPAYVQSLDDAFIGSLVPLENVPLLIERNILPKNYQPTPANYAASYIVRSPVATELLSHFSQHREDFNRVLQEGSAALYRLEGRFLFAQSASSTPPAASAPPPKTVTDAPPPPTQLGTSITSPADPVASAIKLGKDKLHEGRREYAAARFAERMAAQGRR